MMVASAALILAGCVSSSPTVATRRARVPEFAVLSVVVASDAYQAPDAKWSPNLQSTLPKYTGGGLLPVIVGAAVDKHVTAQQQKKFEESQAASLPTINERASQPPSAVVKGAVLSALRANGFFAQRMREDSKNTLEIRILHFGLAEKGKEEGAEPKLSAQILVDLTIRTAGGARIGIGGYSGSSGESLPVGALAKEPGLIPTLYDEAADSLREFLGASLRRKYEG